MGGKNKIEILLKLQNALWRRQISSSSSSLVVLRRVLPPEKPNHENHTTLSGFRFLGTNQVHSLAAHDNVKQSAVDDVHNIIKNHRGSSSEEIERILGKCGIELTEELVLEVVTRNRSDWRPAYVLFQLIVKQSVYLSSSLVYNEILDVLWKMKRFEEFHQVFDEMSKRDGFINEKTYVVLLNRYAAAHKVDEAVGVFERRREFGIEDDLVAFHGLLMWLCRYKHVEFAETLLCSRRREFGCDIKAMNIILNGWCVLGNVHEAKRIWKDIIASKCRPDVVSYGTMINALTKKGKLGKAMELYRAMWETGRNLDVKICNNVIDALCFKKRIPEALQVFKEMGDKGCFPNVVTYNSLLKHLCKIRRTGKVWELVEEMEHKGGSCSPNDVTFGYLLKYSQKPKDVEDVLERMRKNRCEMTSDLYNLMFRLYVQWDNEERVREIWGKMEKSGLGPDQRTYTIRIHGLHTKGKIGQALSYFQEMMSRGMVPEPRTEMLLNQNKTKPRVEDKMLRSNLTKEDESEND
ncbi:PREDICTED: putative pentatricopeptide repeat-containing protein At3g15200 [Camelina sativa]|uniref:Pentatricopeptide repeat-containing protein At3g15200 n=1 Tax=Camelina sativa TaxID=90675 RepID=A0ABM0XKK5_CAMSA|nr:PREDICTED: putative pentatricopeptide repeat-containing protein At3g15200 [Camelina sativa]